MDLMTDSASFSGLKDKYDYFAAPQLRVIVEDVDLIKKLEADMSGITVELTAGSPASGCSFDVVGLYQPKNTGFDENGPAKYLQIGAKVEVELGYIVTEKVFVGLIVEVEYVFENESSAPYVHVECMDAKCLLMKQRRLELFTEKSITDAVTEILDAQPFSDYISGKTVDALTPKINMIPAAGEDDFQFITRFAAYIGYEFFIIAGKAYFRKIPASASSIMTLKPEFGLVSLKLSLRGSGIHKKTKVVGIGAENDKAVSAEEATDAKLSKGNTASRMLGETVQTLFDHQVKSADDASARAKTIMQDAVASFAKLEFTTIGIPELVPGRCVKIEGIAPEVNGDYYLLSVRHSLDEKGFVTTAEARMNKV